MNSNNKTITYGKLYLEIHTNIVELTRINTSVISSIKNSNNTNFISQHNGSCIIKNDFFCNEVENVYRYNVEIKNGKVQIFKFKNKFPGMFIASNFNDRPLSFNSNSKSIVMVLESPHKCEFNTNFKPIAPAQYTTGNWIEKKLNSIITQICMENTKKIPDGRYRFLIINPIPCQTSLHYIHNKNLSGSWKHLRDIVWTSLWKNNSKYIDNLIHTINNVNPILIINACTSNIKNKIINPFLETNYSSTYILYHTDHPSSWSSGINLKRLEE